MRAHDARQLRDGTRVLYRATDGSVRRGTVSGPVRWYRRDSHVAHVPVRDGNGWTLIHCESIIRTE